MDEFKEKHLRPGRKITDQFIIGSVLAFLILSFSVIAFPVGVLDFVSSKKSSEEIMMPQCSSSSILILSAYG